MSLPRRRCRDRRRRTAPAGVAVLCAATFALTACSGDASTAAGQPGGRSDGGSPGAGGPGDDATSLPGAADPAPDALPVRADARDGGTQSLQDVAARDGVVVAVGYDEGGGARRPVVLVSDDDARTFTLARVTDSQGRPPTVGDDLSHVVASQEAWVAAGTDVRGEPVLWRSVDGRSFRSLALAPDVLRPVDEVADLWADEQGFLAVGSTRAPDGSARTVLWRSDDGVAWSRSEPEAAAGARPQGEASGVAVARSGGRVVLAQTVADDDEGAEVDRAAGALRSDDGGRTWQVDDPAPTVVSDAVGRSFFADLAVLPDGTVVGLAQGALRSSRSVSSRGEDWDGVLLAAGPDGWVRTGGFGEAREDVPVEMAVRTPREPGGPARTVVVAAEDRGDARVAQLEAGSADAVRLDDAGTGLRAGRRQVANGVAVTSSDVVVVVGSDAVTGDADAAVWRAAGDEPPRPVDLPVLDSLVEPERSVSTLLPVGAGLVAAGSASGTGGVWETSDGTSFSLLDLPDQGQSGDGQRLADGLVVDGSLVLVGSEDSAEGRRPAVLTRDPEGGWSRADARHLEGGGFSDRRMGGIARGAGGPVVAVGVVRDGQPWTSAGVWVRREDPRWDLVTPTDGEAGPPPTGALAGGPGASREMYDVTAREDGSLVAAGWSEADGQGDATVWTAGDPSSWELRRLARPAVPGATSSWVSHVVADGPALVVVGGVSVAGEASRAWSWRSADGGATWTDAPVADGPAEVADLAGVPGGLVAVGAAGEPGEADAAAWSSADGAAWRLVPLPGRGNGAPVRGPGDQGLAAAAVLGERLVVTGADRTFEGTRSLVRSVPVERLGLPTPAGG